MKNQIQIFLSLDDELRWSQLIRTSFPNVKFLNDNVWKRETDVRESIAHCLSGRAYLFNGDVESLPAVIRKDGQIEGPIAGCVVQVLRPVLTDDAIMLSGRIAVGVESSDHQMKSFVAGIWKALKEVGRPDVVCSDGTINRNYVVGFGLMPQISSGEVKLADRATQIRFGIK